MENNENKEVINLTDEELKEVTGGAQCLPFVKTCLSHSTILECSKRPQCIWENGKCVVRPSNS